MTKIRTQDIEVATWGNPTGFQQHACFVCGKQAYQYTRIRIRAHDQPGALVKIFFQNFLCQRTGCRDPLIEKAKYL